MIGGGWDGEPAVRPETEPSDGPRVRRCAVVTGSRAEFGLLRPVMRAIAARKDLELAVVAAGAHLISPAETYRDVKAEFAIAAAVPMQVAGRTTRADDVQAVAVGVARFGRIFERMQPDWVVVLGDRIEPFAAASAASIGGLAVAHIHGGDRAEGVADEAMRHAITKLSHLHLAATAESAERIVRMGERPGSVHVVGSPAIDDLAGFAPLGDGEFAELGSPRAVFLMHPVGRAAEHEETAASAAIDGLLESAEGVVLALHPNSDPGREGVKRAVEQAAERWPDRVRVMTHLPRARFVGLLKRVADGGGVMVGNSSAGLIECAAIRLPVVDIGARQSGRERPGNVVHASGERAEHVSAAVRKARGLDRGAITNPYGDGRSGERCAELLARVNPLDPGLLRKHNAY